MLNKKIKKTYIRYAHRLPDRLSNEVTFVIILVSIIIHGTIFYFLKPAPPYQPTNITDSVKVNIVSKKEKKMLSEIKQTETEAPDKADVFGYMDHKAKKETVLSKDLAKKSDASKENTDSQQLKKRLKKVIEDLKSAMSPKETLSQDDISKKKYEDFLPSGNQNLNASDSFNQDFSGSDFTLGQALDVNMKRHPLMSYFSKIRQSVELAFFNIPRRRISSFMDRNGIKRMVGQSIALVRVSRNGVIEKIKIVESNGHSIIDNHWTKIITDSGPYPPIPKTWKPNYLQFTYRLNYQYM